MFESECHSLKVRLKFLRSILGRRVFQRVYRSDVRRKNEELEGERDFALFVLDG